jgi:hypothetical protein
MIAIPAIAMCGMLAMLSMVAATILHKPWQRWVAVGCATLETAMVIFLVIAAHG